MMFGVNEVDAFVDDITQKDYGSKETFRGRRNSMDGLLGPMASQGRISPKQRSRRGSVEAPLVNGDAYAAKKGLINTRTTSSDNQSNGRNTAQNQNTPSALITVSRMSSGNYERIDESECESGSSSQIESEFSGTSSERARKKDMK